MKAKMISAALGLAAALAAGAAHAAPVAKTTLPEDIIKAIYEKFRSYNIKTMTYDETRVISHEQTGGKQTGVMKIDPMNSAALKIRYYFQAPDKHGYRVLSDPIKDYWVGSPNQPGAMPMDSKWLDKILNWFDIHRGEDKTHRGVNCHVIALVPKPGAPEGMHTMTWFVDSEKLVILKFIFTLKDANNKPMRTEGDLVYDNFNGRYLASSATWRTTVSILPYVFIHNSAFDNHTFNIPLDESVFKEEFPDRWFEILKEPDPYER